MKGNRSSKQHRCSWAVLKSIHLLQHLSHLGKLTKNNCGCRADKEMCHESAHGELESPILLLESELLNQSWKRYAECNSGS